MATNKSRCIQVVALFVVFGLIFVAFIRSSSSFHDCVLDEPTAKNAAHSGSDCPVNAILCGVKDSENDKNLQDYDSLRSEFHRLVTTVNFHCPTTLRFGRSAGGGYDACMARSIRPSNRSCLVYSFGISNDWSFDEAWARYGCEVHSFDPSIGLEDHVHSPNVFFHNLGLWGSDTTNRYGWKLERLSTIRDRLRHKEVVIDVLKIDVEGGEWPFLRDVIYSAPNELSNVRQLYMEFHTPKFRFCSNMMAADFAEINGYVRRLRGDLHFLLYKNIQRNNCCGGFSDLMPPGVYEKCCHEVFFVNSRLLST